MKERRIRWGLAFAVSLCAWLLSELAPSGGPVPTLGLEQANAVVGRPLTPVSYAGVARRTVRRGGYY